MVLEKSETEKDKIQKERPPIKLREYQKELAEKALAGENTIICAETGTGKTWVALHITKEHLRSTTDGMTKSIK